MLLIPMSQLQWETHFVGKIFSARHGVLARQMFYDFNVHIEIGRI